MTEHLPPEVRGAFRVTLVVTNKGLRLDSLLIEALRGQKENSELKNISRTQFKELFNKKKVRIKGQAAKPSSSLALGTTYVDILGFEKA